MRTSFRSRTLALVAGLAFALSAPLLPGGSVASGSRTSAAMRDSAHLARLEGTIEVPGLDSVVEVRRDTWGVPHIYARTAHDLMFAQGYVVAQDRLFQMEMWRRQGEGRLAEVLGPSAANRDRVARLFRYRGSMTAEWASYAPDAKALVHAFVSGVNAQMRDASANDRLPVEFGILGFKPEPWTDDVPLARATSLSGTDNATDEVLRAELISKIGVARTESIMPTDPVRHLDPAPGLDLHGIDTSSLGAASSAFADIAYVRREGSNNWVVDGRRSVTGKPILANDPHRAITHPAVRYITHLVAPGWNVIGAGEPASPGVAIGHNASIAFGLTIVGMDQQDLYVERIAPCPSASDPALRCAEFRGHWEPLRTIIDTIHVRGASPRITRLEFTRHGPILSEDSTAGRTHRAIAMRSVHAEPGTASYLASLALDRATNWREFRSAMARWKMPSENMIYADTAGHIGWIAAGLMPVRSWSGLLPVPGDGSREWSRFLSIDQLPQALDPKRGWIATANDNILPAGYRRTIAYDWGARYRIDRIREVLRGGGPFSVDAFEALQHDDESLVARFMVPALERAARRMGAAQREDVRLLASWNRRMSRDQVAPLVFEAWAPIVARGSVALRVPPEVARRLGQYANYEALERWSTALEHSGDRALLARHDSLLLSALDSAVTLLTKRFGADRSRWTWGEIHRATFRHPLDPRFDLPAVSRGGDGNTVYATSANAMFRQTAGASFREIIDLADFDRSVTINVPGQSAQPGSEYYGNLLPLWGNDRYFPMLFSRAAVERATKHVLLLAPSR